jgi:DNA repair exonuclease SbcCD ATPase subunit
MTEEQSDNFKFGMDTEIPPEGPDEVVAEDLQERRISKLSRRVTLLAVLLPCVIGVVLFFLYLDLKKRVIQDRVSGTRTVQNLSQDIETRLEGLAGRFAELEQKLSDTTASLESSIGSLQQDVKKSNARLRQVRSAKADRSDQEAIQQNLQQISATLITLEENLAARISQLSESVDKVQTEMMQINADVSTLIISKLDRNTFQQELDREQKDTQKKIQDVAGNLENKIRAVRGDIRQLENEINDVRRTARSPQPSPAPQSQAGGQPPEPPESGKIIEKDIN